MFAEISLTRATAASENSSSAGLAFLEYLPFMAGTCGCLRRCRRHRRPRSRTTQRYRASSVNRIPTAGSPTIGLNRLYHGILDRQQNTIVANPVAILSVASISEVLGKLHETCAREARIAGIMPPGYERLTAAAPAPIRSRSAPG